MCLEKLFSAHNTYNISYMILSPHCQHKSFTNECKSLHSYNFETVTDMAGKILSKIDRWFSIMAYGLFRCVQVYFFHQD